MGWLKHELCALFDCRWVHYVHPVLTPSAVAAPPAHSFLVRRAHLRYGISLPLQHRSSAIPFAGGSCSAAAAATSATAAESASAVAAAAATTIWNSKTHNLIGTLRGKCRGLQDFNAWSGSWYISTGFPLFLSNLSGKIPDYSR